mgnify:CR=1 FL=1
MCVGNNPNARNEHKPFNVSILVLLDVCRELIGIVLMMLYRLVSILVLLDVCREYVSIFAYGLANA